MSFETVEMKIIARIRTDFTEKFGIPRQSGLVPELKAKIIFEKEFRSADALRGLEGYSYIWLIWHFSQTQRQTWSPTVRPPRLGGNKRMGVFATRSPFRPNSIGLSSVKLERIEYGTASGPVIHVSGADLMDGTPIFDIKPYAPYADCHTDARGGFTDDTPRHMLQVDFPAELAARVPGGKLAALTGVLANDPRPAYQNDPERTYGFIFAGMEIRFRVSGQTLTVMDIQRQST